MPVKQSKVPRDISIFTDRHDRRVATLRLDDGSKTRVPVVLTQFQQRVLQEIIEQVKIYNAAQYEEALDTSKRRKNAGFGTVQVAPKMGEESVRTAEGDRTADEEVR